MEAVTKCKLRSSWSMSIWRQRIGWCNGGSDSVHLFVSLQPLECDKLTSHVSWHGVLAGGIQSVGRHTVSWSYIQGETCNTEIVGRLAVWQSFLGRCCTQCILYSVHAEHSIYCTQRILNSVYTAHGICCTCCILREVLTHDDVMDKHSGVA